MQGKQGICLADVICVLWISIYAQPIAGKCTAAGMEGGDANWTDVSVRLCGVLAL